ncbi:related to vacuolar protein sorting-associated protein VPS5 [Cephalotrichum gorgonifer]|uniref:Related to vacuolar protein sorting-associated protein VPS5 n=1 Tax=Cephalotrichum gorgonifer TaxID=2041049 RepID=A0AAE8MS95_9PEZI|nr:related to vacuolar protein sorting-associated protein VPS5 [Cephalotrichum gorgonifer]
MDPEESPWADSAPPSAEASQATESTDAPPSQASTTTKSSLATTTSTGTTRVPRTPRRLVAQPTRLSAVDDPLGPLGGGGSSSAEESAPPAPPQKEVVTMRTTMQGAQDQKGKRTGGARDPHAIDDDEVDVGGEGGRAPPPVQAASPTISSGVSPGVSVEEAAKVSFHITVGDPHKVGDLTSSHIVYSVRTKTTSKGYKQPEFEVKRRYRDFLWLYNTLHGNCPGVIIPPPPDKQAVGRFESNFVEARRSALERMLNRIASHPTLQHDPDLKLFLESESFNVDIKHKERREPLPSESKGVFGSLGISVGSSSKFVEQDDWFHDRKIYLDALENQLKSLLKSTETMVAQRKAMAEAAGDFSSALHALSTVELSPTLSGPLDALSELQLTIRDVYERQAQQDVLTLGIVIEEYIRLIGSVKQAFQQRQRSFYAWHSAEADLQKKRTAQEKLLRQGRSQQDRLNQVGVEVGEAERKVQAARTLFDDMGKLMRVELDRFEKEKVEDFKSGVETFLESAVEAQKELIEKWETFLMQLDAEDDESVFYRPPVIQTGNNSGGDTAIDRARARMDEDSD